MTKDLGKQAIAAFVGGTLGVVAAVHLSQDKPGRASPPPVANAGSVQPISSGAGAPLNITLGGWDEERIKALEANVGKVAASAAPGLAAPPEASVAIAEFRKHLTELVREHELQPRDLPWAQPTEALLTRDLATMAAAAGFASSSVECRTNSCLVKAVWPTYAEATKASKLMLHAKYGANCTRTVMMEPPDDDSKPYEGRVLFDCRDWQN